MRRLALAFGIAAVLGIAYGQGASCLHHDHCGAHAVCVTEDATGAPRCRCLVGFRSSGRSCVENKGNLATQAQAVLNAAQETIIIEKCGDGNTGRSAAANNAIAAAKVSQKVQSKTSQSATSKESEGSSAVGGAAKPRTLKVPCSPVECDFSNGPCAYQNDYYSEWQLREIEGGTILLSSGDSKTEHYLLSSTLTVEQPSLLLFDYFESSLSDSHLSVYSRDLATLIWKAAGKEAGWQQAVATIAPGRHQIIFAAEKLKAGELAAVTNIRLVDSSGSPAGCF